MSVPPRSASPVLTPASAHPVLEPQVQQVVDQILDLDLPPMRERDLARTRDWARQAQSTPEPALPIDVVDVDLSIGPHRSVPARLLAPAGVQGPLPIVFYLHGGGWVMGDRHTHDRIARELAHETQAAVVLVDYPLAPEQRFPVQNEETYAALEALVGQAGSLGLDGARVAIAGDCAGGAIAAAVALMAKARHGPQILGQALFYPITAAASANASYAAFGEGPGPTSQDMRFFQESLVGGPVRAEHFVLETPLAKLKGLPPTLIITAEADVVRDEGEAYGRRLMRAGVCVTSLRVNGTVHDFMVLEALKDTCGARAAMAVAKDFLNRVLRPATLAFPAD